MSVAMKKSPRVAKFDVPAGGQIKVPLMAR